MSGEPFNIHEELRRHVPGIVLPPECAANSCPGTPVATWTARLRLDGADSPVWATLLLCAAHDQGMSDAPAWPITGTVGRISRD